jgi:hypothetical protein
MGETYILEELFLVELFKKKIQFFWTPFLIIIFAGQEYGPHKSSPKFFDLF